VKEDMRDYSEPEDYEVGYRKPPKSSQFKKGVSGNPLGRPKKASDFGSELIRELNSKLTINENGQQKIIKKYEGVTKQLVNKALSGNLMATRLLVPYYQQALEKAAEEHQSALDRANRTVEELTDEELMALIRAQQPELK
jgi:Family of unknown function (DUF5681)